MSRPKYLEYKDSEIEWLGDLPSHWRTIPLKRVASCNDSVLSEKTPENTLIEYVEISDVDSVLGITGSTAHPFSEAPSRARRRVRDQDVLVSTVRTYLKAITPVRNPPPNMVVSTGFAVIRPDFNHLTGGFLGYLFRSEWIISEIIARSVGVSYPAINASDIMQLSVPIPQQQEQVVISCFLDHETAKIDALIHEQQRLIELLQEKRQAVISHAVTKGLDPTVAMKDSGVEWLGEVPAHWSVEPLKYLCSFSGGGTPAKENLEYWNGDIPWVSPKDMKSFRISGSKDKITGLALNESSTSLVKAGALLMVVRSGILQRTIPIGINSVDVTLNQDMKALRFKNPDFAEYFAYFIKGYEPSLLIEWRKQGATVESIEQEYLGESLTLVPPLNEVAKIIEHLSHVDQRYGSLQAEAKKSSAMLLERRSALISAAVTGKIDVRNWQPPADERVFDEEMRQAEMKVIA